MVQEPLLAIRSASKASERSVRTKHAVAWNDDAERILPDRRTDRPYGERMFHVFGNISIPQRFSKIDLLKLLPNLNLKIGPLKIQRDGESFSPPIEILLKLPSSQFDNRIVLSLNAGISWRMLMSFKIDSAQSFRLGYEG